MQQVPYVQDEKKTKRHMKHPINVRDIKGILENSNDRHRILH
jgi:hypothetical protein